MTECVWCGQQLPKPVERKFCIDCKHITSIFPGGDKYCKHYLALDFVDKSMNTSCTTCRMLYSMCGQDAKWFESKCE
jgi:hypothetical protein